jgi:uncharacterized protein (DUF58 family)
VTAPTRAPIGQLALTVFRRLEGLLAGDYAGLLPGHGSERGEARPYVAGDDPRHIDWAVTARTPEPHVRDFISDHELEVWVVLDTSSSMAFGTVTSTKHELAWNVAGAVALVAARGGNRVGALATGSTRAIPARSGMAHVSAVLTALAPAPEDGTSGDLALALGRVRALAKRRGLVVVVSDFQGEPTWERPLRVLAARHDVLAIEVGDPRERVLPDVGLIAVVDPESGRRRLADTGDAALRRRFASAATRRRGRTIAALSRAGADHLVVSTDGDWVLDLVRFISSRRARRAAARKTS